MIRQLRALLVSFFFLPLCSLGFAQSAQIQGQVADSSGAVIPKALVRVIDQHTGTERKVETNRSGQYSVPGLDPSLYKIFVQASGFSTAASTPITLNVAQNAVLDFTLQVGNGSEVVTVNASDLSINTTDGSVSTVIDRKFVENIPLNGRSFQDLISLTPGVVTQSPQSGSQLNVNGDFSVNGQRTESNYYMVDGVSGNIGSGNGYGSPTAGAGGGLAGSTALGTTQGLLSVDALQEFRVESSSYSAEYGHSPGGQFSFATRSGTNDLHGTVFDYLRNNFFDANDWFNDHAGKPQPALRQNDFGGTIGGPVIIPKLYSGKDRTFFFVSYEGLRLTQPQAATIQYVPDTYLRQQAAPALQPILNSFPIQNGLDYGSAASPNLAQFIQAYSVPSSINSTSIRLDQKLNSTSTLFFRFSDTPTQTESRSLSVLTTTNINERTYTLGTTSQLGSRTSNEFRLGYASADGSVIGALSNFGGATSINMGQTMGLGDSPSTEAEMLIYFSGVGEAINVTQTGATRGTQWNFVDTVSRTWGRHQIKIGVDYRRITTALKVSSPYAIAEFLSASSLINNQSSFLQLNNLSDAEPRFNDSSLFAQDEWRINSKIAISGGLRWEVSPPPTGADGHDAYTLLGSINQPSSLQLAPKGTPLWHTTWYNFAPRLGVAWSVHDTPGWQTVFRSGGGVFFDNANQVATQGFNEFGFTSTSNLAAGSPLPVTPAQLDFQPSLLPPYTSSVIFAFPSHLQLPYTFQWNSSIQQGIGRSQSLTLSYVGANGRRLMGKQELSLTKLNPNFGSVFYFPTSLTSSYNALQAQFQRSISKGIQVLASYTWAHSLDFGSTYAALPLERGNSDFDVRNSFSGGISWELPSIQANRLLRSVLDNWGLDGRAVARSGFPVTLGGSLLTDPATGSQYNGGVNLIPGRPVYLYGSQYPGGRALNGGPLTTSSTAALVTAGTSVGDAPRNFVRGFGENQINLAARRQFDLGDTLRLQFRAEAFNILNHPNFGYVDPLLRDATFGQATKMLNQSLATVASQYQQGGPRSMQFSLKIIF